MAVSSTISPNPITQAELIYQDRSAPRRRPWLAWLGCILLTLSFTLAFMLVGGEFAGALLHRDPEPINRFVGVASLLPLAMAVFLHFALMLRTLSLSANSIAREKQANNWEILVLTGVDAHQIIRGKWIATIKRMWHAYVMLAILRAAVIIWYGASISRDNAFSFASYYQTYGPVEVIVPTPASFIAAALTVFVLTMINLPFTAACGVSAISSNGRNSALVFARAISTRLVLLLGVSIGVMALMSFIWTRVDSTDYSQFMLWVEVSRFIQSILVVLLDNGFGTATTWVSYSTTQFLSFSGQYPLLTALAASVIYGLFTWGLLRFAQWQAARQNALSPLRSPKPKRL